MSHGIIIGTQSASGGVARPLPRPDRIRRHIAANFYPSPPEAVRALLSVERFDGAIHEPACGEGDISRELIDAGHQVVSTDLNDWGYGVSGRVFLQQRTPLAKHIITNPPYGSGLADAFIRHALILSRQTGGKMAMLVNLSSLAHANRTPLWRTTPPARLYAIDSVLC